MTDDDQSLDHFLIPQSSNLSGRSRFKSQRLHVLIVHQIHSGVQGTAAVVPYSILTEIFSGQKRKGGLYFKELDGPVKCTCKRYLPIVHR